VILGLNGCFAKWWLGLLIGHFQKEQAGEPLDTIALADALISQDIAVIPLALDDR